MNSPWICLKPYRIFNTNTHTQIYIFHPFQWQKTDGITSIHRKAPGGSKRLLWAYKHGLDALVHDNHRTLAYTLPQAQSFSSGSKPEKTCMSCIGKAPVTQPNSQSLPEKKFKTGKANPVSSLWLLKVHGDVLWHAVIWGFWCVLRAWVGYLVFKHPQGHMISRNQIKYSFTSKWHFIPVLTWASFIKYAWKYTWNEDEEEKKVHMFWRTIQVSLVNAVQIWIHSIQQKYQGKTNPLQIKYLEVRWKSNNSLTNVNYLFYKQKYGGLGSDGYAYSKKQFNG